MEKMRICLSKVMYGILFLIVIPALLIIWARYTSDLIHLSVPANLFGGYLLLGTGLLLAVTGMFHLWIFDKGLPMNTFPPNTFVKKGIYVLFRILLDTLEYST